MMFDLVFIERFLSKLKHFRRVAARYDKLAANAPRRHRRERRPRRLGAMSFASESSSRFDTSGRRRGTGTTGRGGFLVTRSI